MEILGIVDCPLWILLLLGIIASVVLYSKWKQNVLRTLGLPGPKPALFFGIFPMYKQKGIALTDLELVKKYGKVVGIYHGNTPNILIADPEMIEEICVKKFSNFQNRSSVLDLGCLLQRSVALSQGSKWVDLRAKLVSVFSCSNIKQTTDLLHECIDNLMIKIEDNSETSIDISVFCRNYSMDAISKLVFGLSINTHDDPNNEMARMAHKAWVAGTSDVVGKSTICVNMANSDVLHLEDDSMNDFVWDERSEWPETGSVCNVVGCTVRFHFKKLRDYFEHWRKIHTLTHTVYQCYMCGNKFPKMQTLKKHLIHFHKCEKSRAVEAAVSVIPEVIVNPMYIDPKETVPPRPRLRQVVPNIEERQRAEQERKVIISAVNPVIPVDIVPRDEVIEITIRNGESQAYRRRKQSWMLEPKVIVEKVEKRTEDTFFDGLDFE